MVALRNLYRNKIRNALTLVGVAVGISVFVSSLALSSGFKNQIQDIIRGYSIDINVLAKGAPTPLSSRITLSDYRALGRTGGVRDISAVILGTLKAPWNNYFLIAGISAIEALSSKINLLKGRMFTPQRRELILGNLAAEALGYTVGNKILLGPDELFTITGIFQVGSRFFDGAATLDIVDAQRLLKREHYVNMAFVQVAAGSGPEDIAQRISERFPHLSAIRTGDFIGQLRVFETIDLFVWVISAISLFTCCVVVMNTLFMAIAERTKEIGILMAIGWSRLMIFRTILLEALILCLLGGLGGNGVSVLCLRAFNQSQAIGMGWIPVRLPLDIVGYSLAISLILGLASAFFPALMASRLLPAEALRYE